MTATTLSASTTTANKNILQSSPSRSNNPNDLQGPAHRSFHTSWAAGSSYLVVFGGFRRQECWQQAAYWFGIAQAQDQRQGRMAPRDAEIIRGRA